MEPTDCCTIERMLKGLLYLYMSQSNVAVSISVCLRVCVPDVYSDSQMSVRTYVCNWVLSEVFLSVPETRNVQPDTRTVVGWSRGIIHH